MKTYTPKIGEIEKKWYIVDAKDKVLGQVATKIADKLRGKGKPIFAPHLDCGDFVVVINAEKVKLTGNKLEGKKYYTHSKYPGGLKEESAGKMLERHPEKVIELAVNGMLPKNKLRKAFMRKLKIFTGESHPHEAQQPIKLEV